MVEQTRITCLADYPIDTTQEIVVYWMQAAQRVQDNHALAYAVQWANTLQKPLIVSIVVRDDYPGATARAYQFFLEGVSDVQNALRARGIACAVSYRTHGTSLDALIMRAALVVTDVGYTRFQRAWRAEIASRVRCRMDAVDTNSIVPVAYASSREEYSARTIRGKIMPKIDAYSKKIILPHLQKTSSCQSWDVSDPVRACAQITCDRRIVPVEHCYGGETAAHKRLRAFVAQGLANYAQKRNDPCAQHTSRLSSFLHFGHIAPQAIARAVQTASVSQEDREAFIEELVVRRELAANFVWYNSRYDQFSGLPEWAIRTLHAHMRDPRDAVYHRAQFDAAQTHDPLWNAAQMALRRDGYLHGYLRMYWGKQVLAWSASPEEAFATLVWLNDRYEIDGRDPSGYAGIAWCFGKHDRPWFERPVFGMVRSMTAAGAARKIDVATYCAWAKKQTLH